MVWHLERIAVATEKTAAAIDETNTLLRRYLASESGEKRGKKVGQLSAHLMERGIRLVQKDPNRNVSQAARKLCKPGCGYKNEGSLRSALDRKWREMRQATRG